MRCAGIHVHLDRHAVTGQAANVFKVLLEEQVEIAEREIGRRQARQTLGPRGRGLGGGIGTAGRPAEQ
jgi:hypothetical protein